jgi:hypothetical protein
VKHHISTKTTDIHVGNVEMSPSMAPLGAGARQRKAEAPVVKKLRRTVTITT